jgi:methyl halide transferase
MQLDKNFWDQRYESGQTGWDIGAASPPLTEYIDSLQNKSIRILIPGCGNAYEAEYLLQKDFRQVTLIDLSASIVNKLTQQLVPRYEGCIRLLHGDFFELEGEFDLILEQTFFCALAPELRADYVKKMWELLAPNGRLAGVLFNRTFEAEGPPFGGSKEEYQKLFEPYFTMHTFETAHNSIAPRAGQELFIELEKKEEPQSASAGS